MKNIILKSLIACLFVSHAQAAVDTINSLIVTPRAESSVATHTPVIAGIMRNNQHKPIKNKPVTIFVDNRKVATVPTNKYGVFSYKLVNAQALDDGCHLVQACVAQSPTNISWGKGSIFQVQARTSNTTKSGNVSAANSSISFPFDGSYINATTPTVIGSLLDSNFSPVAGETVQVKIDSTTVGSPTSDSNGIFSYGLATPLTESSHTVDAHCVQSSVNLTTNNFTIDVTPPAAPTMSAPTENQTVTNSLVTVSGTTEAFASITTYMDGSIYGDMSYADGSGNWSLEYDLVNGAHSVTAEASDLANNTGSVSAARNFTVNA